jgi:hypothetical protein
LDGESSHLPTDSILQSYMLHSPAWLTRAHNSTGTYKNAVAASAVTRPRRNISYCPSSHYKAGEIVPNWWCFTLVIVRSIRRPVLLSFLYWLFYRGGPAFCAAFFTLLNRASTSNMSCSRILRILFVIYSAVVGYSVVPQTSVNRVRCYVGTHSTAHETAMQLQHDGVDANCVIVKHICSKMIYSPAALACEAVDEGRMLVAHFSANHAALAYLQQMHKYNSTQIQLVYACSTHACNAPMEPLAPVSRMLQPLVLCASQSLPNKASHDLVCYTGITTSGSKMIPSPVLQSDITPGGVYCVAISRTCTIVDIAHNIAPCSGNIAVVGDVIRSYSPADEDALGTLLQLTRSGTYADLLVCNTHGCNNPMSDHCGTTRTVVSHVLGMQGDVSSALVHVERAVADLEEAITVSSVLLLYVIYGVCLDVCWCLCVYARVHILTSISSHHTYIYVHSHPYIHTCIHTHTYMCSCMQVTVRLTCLTCTVHITHVMNTGTDATIYEAQQVTNNNDRDRRRRTYEAQGVTTYPSLRMVQAVSSTGATGITIKFQILGVSITGATQVLQALNSAFFLKDVFWNIQHMPGFENARPAEETSNGHAPAPIENILVLLGFMACIVMIVFAIMYLMLRCKAKVAAQVVPETTNPTPASAPARPAPAPAPVPAPAPGTASASVPVTITVVGTVVGTQACAPSAPERRRTGAPQASTGTGTGTSAGAPGANSGGPTRARAPLPVPVPEPAPVPVADPISFAALAAAQTSDAASCTEESQEEIQEGDATPDPVSG